MKADLEGIMRRIRALQERTVERGCTEEEAMSAARLMSKLLNEHGLSMSDVQIKERTDCEELDIITGRKRAHEISFCMVAISKYCDCKVWMSGGNYTFYGFPEDTKAAKWLYDLILSAMTYELVKYKRRTGLTGRRESHAFLLGMAKRISTRLREIKSSQSQETKNTTGRDLVVVKSRTVESHFRNTGISLTTNRRSTTIGSTSAYSAGQEAGNRVGFNRGVSRQTYLGG